MKKSAMVSILMVSALLLAGCGQSSFRKMMDEQTKKDEAAAAAAGNNSTPPVQDSTPNSSQSTPDAVSSSNETALTSNDFVTYDNGVKLQVDNASKTFKNGLEDILTKYLSGAYSVNKVRLQAGDVLGIFNVMSDLFKNEKTPAGLEKVTGEYTAEMQQMEEILSEMQSVVSTDQITKRQQMMQDVLSQKDATDKEYANIKASVMKKVSSDTKTAATSSDSHLKSGPAKVASAGGLGDTYATIVSEFGDPTQVNQPMKDGVGMFVFQNSKILADFVQSRAYHVTYQLDDNPLTMDQAQALAKKLMPPDAVFVKKYTKDGQEFDVYQSKTLDPLFDHNWFENADGVYQPGYFDIAYMFDGDSVTSVDAFTSDNP